MLFRSLNLTASRKFHVLSDIVELNQQTGEIRFLSKDGKLLLTDTKTRLEARKDEGNKGKYRIEQDFRLADDEAIYGLGQLRDVYMNQRGRQNIELWNHREWGWRPARRHP